MKEKLRQQEKEYFNIQTTVTVGTLNNISNAIKQRKIIYLIRNAKTELKKNSSNSKNNSFYFKYR